MEHHREQKRYKKTHYCYVCQYFHGKPRVCQKEICVWNEENIKAKETEKTRMIIQKDYMESDCCDCPYHGVDGICIGFCMKKILKEHYKKWDFRYGIK